MKMLTHTDTFNNVYHRNLLAEEFQQSVPAETPWILELATGERFFATDEEACSAQREFRVAQGLDPITGEVANG